MDRLALAFTERFLVSLALALIGFLAIRYGYKLFLSGVGLKDENGKLKFSGPKIRIEMVTSSVGGVLMMTSLGWGGITYLSLPTLTPERVASADTVIRGLALGDSSQLTTAATAAVADFAKTARATMKSNPNAKVLVVTTSGDPDETAKRKSAIFDALVKAGLPKSKIDQKAIENMQFNEVVKTIDPASRQKNLNAAIILAPHL